MIPVAKRLSLLTTSLVTACLFPQAVTWAQFETPQAPAKAAPAQFDPSEYYFQGWLLTKDYEELLKQGKEEDALAKLKQAKQYFDKIRANYPDWQRKDMLNDRIRITEQALAQLGPKVAAKQQQNRNAIAELEGRKINGPTDEETAPEKTGDSLDNQRMRELTEKVQRLESQLNASPDSAARNAAKAGDLSRMNESLRAELQASKEELNRLKERYAAEPMQEEVQRLNLKLKALEGEKFALGQALQKSQDETQKAKSQIDALQRERSVLNQKISDLSQALKDERTIQNEVIEGQQKQMRQLQDALRTKSDELTDANQKIAALQGQLEESHKSFEELKTERDDLMRQRDQMSALLKLNDGGRIQELIDQNMSMAKELREAGQKIENLSQDNNKTKDDYIDALRDLAIAKRNINQFRTEKNAREQHLNELEERLRREDKQLSEEGGNPEETNMLRDMLQKQLRAQERRRQAREILMQTLETKASTEPQLKQALDLLNGAEQNLTPDEMKAINSASSDTVLYAAKANSPEDAMRASQQLQRESTPFIQAAEKAYIADRLQSSRELLEMVLDRNPGDTLTMSRLGAVNLKLNDLPAAADMFRRATELDPRNPYAHRMLGRTLIGARDYQGALAPLQKSVELAPTSAEGHSDLGSLYYQLGQAQLAETEFKSAISFNDSLAEPYNNLAFLYAAQGKKAQAREYYKGALERGGVPDPNLEKQMAEAPVPQEEEP
jgi:Tfp pilus assembly protein PilF